jgi:hypothetical protein
VLLLLLLLQATHLIIGTMGVLDVPSEFESAEPVRMDFDFTQHAKWGEYWSKMQVRRWGAAAGLPARADEADCTNCLW